MFTRVLVSDVVQTDDTPVKVQDHDGKGIKTGRLWVHVGDHDHRFTVYDYTPDHSGAGPRRVFKGYEGYLQADACSVVRRLVRRRHDQSRSGAGCTRGGSSTRRRPATRCGRT